MADHKLFFSDQNQKMKSLQFQFLFIEKVHVENLKLCSFQTNFFFQFRKL